jgi:LPS-assembly protein
MGKAHSRRSDERVRGGLTAALALTFALACGSVAQAEKLPGLAPAAKTLADAKPAADRDPAKLYLDADKLVYDKDRDVVNADGGVVLYYKGRILQGDHVRYDRKAKRVFATGHVKLTDEHGNITYAKTMELTDDFAAGFADGVQVLTIDRSRLTSPRIERSNDAITVLQNGVYTACEPCKSHPESPPLWQIRAKQITENQDTHTIYFRDAYFDAFGVPVAYIPYFSAPDPTVTRQSGFLAPSFISKSYLGLGVTTPYFFALAPNYDLTLSPSFFTMQGPFLDAEWRHRTDNGVYNVRLTGIDQLQPGKFLAEPYGAGNLKVRGSLESQGKFYLNPNWTVGWDLTLLSDRFYLNDYRLRALDTSQYFFQDVVSQVYLRGQAGRGFFDLSGYSFQPTDAFLDRRQDPIAAPVFDFHRTFALDAEHWGGIGGEVTAEFNVASVNREEALYQNLQSVSTAPFGAQRLDAAYGLYQVCGAGTAADYAPTNAAGKSCLLRGVGGDYTRATEQVSWAKKIVDPLGEVWKPFAFERVSGEAAELSNGSYTYASANGSAIIPNYAQPAFFSGQSSGSAATGMAGVGLEYRYPFIAETGLGEQILEPIGQLIVRPNETLPTLHPNEDAQSLVFDDTTLFQWSKYSGYDRVEGGTRANYGLQYVNNLPSGGHVNIVAGQSAQLAGQNSYTLLDATNTGLGSGLDKRWSNVVAGETLQPTAAPLTLGLKQQFDSTTFSLARFDAVLGGKWGGFEGMLDYAQYQAQPEIGYAFPRQGLITKASYKFENGVVFSGGVTLDMSRRYYDPSYGSPFYPAQWNVGLAYDANNCTTVKIAYNSTLVVPLASAGSTATAPSQRDQTLLFEIDLRTLGDVKSSTGVH